MTGNGPHDQSVQLHPDPPAESWPPHVGDHVELAVVPFGLPRVRYAVEGEPVFVIHQSCHPVLQHQLHRATLTPVRA